MLLLAYLEREGAEVPAVLQTDLRFVLQKAPLLLEEMIKITIVPRPPIGYGWLVSILRCMLHSCASTYGLYRASLCICTLVARGNDQDHDRATATYRLRMAGEHFALYVAFMCFYLWALQSQSVHLHPCC